MRKVKNKRDRNGKNKAATIPDKTTWESFPHHVHSPTQQNYFQNDAFAGRKPLPPIQCCFPQTPRDQAFFWIHNNIAFRGRGRGKNRYSNDFEKNAVQVYNFLNSLVQDCRTIMTRGKDRFMFRNNWIQSWLKKGTLDWGFHFNSKS